MREYLAARFNFDNGSFVLVVLILSCAFVATVLLFAFDFTNVADEDFKELFWSQVGLITTRAHLSRSPWTLFTYSFFDQKILAVFSSAFWIMVLGSRMDSKARPYLSLAVFMLTTVIAGLVAALVGISQSEDFLLYSARVPLLAMAAFVIIRYPHIRIKIATQELPLIYLAGFYVLLSLIDMWVIKSPSLIAAYITSALIGLAATRFYTE